MTKLQQHNSGESEAVRRLVVRGLPLTVAIDSAGGNLYESGPRAYRESAQEQP